MALVFFTYIIFGALMPYAVKYSRTLDPAEPIESLKSKEIDDQCANHEDHVDPNQNMNYSIDFCHPNFIPQ